MNLIKLAERVEGAAGPCWQLDEAIDRTVREWPAEGDYLASEHAIWKRGTCSVGMIAERADGYARASICAPRYTASIDAALQLVPDECFWRLGHDGNGPDPSDFRALVLETPGSGLHQAVAATPALALTAAALRAKAGEG